MQRGQTVHVSRISVRAGKEENLGRVRMPEGQKLGLSETCGSQVEGGSPERIFHIDVGPVLDQEAYRGAIQSVGRSVQERIVRGAAVFLVARLRVGQNRSACGGWSEGWEWVERKI